MTKDNSIEPDDNLRPRSLRGLEAVALGLVSLVLPLVTFFGFEEPLAVPFDHPARIAYYRQTVLAFVLEVVLGLAALLSGGRSSERLLRLTGIGLGGGGLVVGVLLLLTLVGLCGSTVLWGLCKP